MGIIFGSARIDENGKASGGSAGDQTGKEVSTQSYYMHSKGWYVLRPKDANIASKMAQLMLDACNNNNIGYDQSNRDGVITHGIHTTTKTECDCSTLVRACCREAGISVGNFTTYNEASTLESTGAFESKKNCTGESMLYNGDVLVTKTKGHTVIVVSGRSRGASSSSSTSDIDTIAREVIAGKWGNGDDRKKRLENAGYNYEEVRARVNEILKGGASSSSYYPKYTGSSTSLDTVLKAIGVPSTYYGSWKKRKPLADKNGINSYTGSAAQNIQLLALAKNGKLKTV